MVSTMLEVVVMDVGLAADLNNPSDTALTHVTLVTHPCCRSHSERRISAMGIRVNKVHEEEWSYIPVGGPLPTGDQPIAAFGAAANLVHPATGMQHPARCCYG